MVKVEGEIVQIIKNNRLKNYMIYSWLRVAVEQSGKDLVVIKNLNYPGGWKGFLLSFKRNAPERTIVVLTDATALKKGDYMVGADMDKFMVDSGCYIEREKVIIR